MQDRKMTAAPAAPHRSRPPRGSALGLTLLVAGLALSGCGAPRQAAGPEGVPPGAGAPPAGSTEALAATLPANADAFARGATVPVRQPMEGLEVNYATPNRRGAAFVQIVRPAAGAAGAAAAEYSRWLTEASTGARPGRRLRVAEEFNEPGGPGLRCAALEGSYGRQPVQTTLCVGATGGHVVRLRVSMMRDTPPAADARAFLGEIARGLPRG